MDRTTWLEERKAAVRSDYDETAQSFDEHPYAADAQHDWVRRLLAMLPAGALVLDAPCGTGRYFPVVAEAGMRVAGIDGSAGMLEQARARGIAVSLAQVPLEDLAVVAEFDAAVTIDAMEHVPPEDWPVVLRNLHRAIKPGGPMYLTVEEADDAAIDAAFRTLSERGLPAVRGEVTQGGSGGYHFYPGRERVLAWFESEGLDVVDEGYKRENGWAYRHFLLRG